MIVALLMGHHSVELAAVADVGPTFKATQFSASGVYDHQDIAAEPLGNCAVTLTGIIVGSAIQFETQAGTPIENRTAASSSETFNVPAYSPGSASNDLRIKVRKGSAAPYYQPYETLTTAAVGAQSIYVSQIPD